MHLTPTTSSNHKLDVTEKKAKCIQFKKLGKKNNKPKGNFKENRKKEIIKRGKAEIKKQKE